MAAFEHQSVSRNGRGRARADGGAGALSVAAVENDFVEGVYEKLASTYDFVFGPTLHAGRLQAAQKIEINPGRPHPRGGCRDRHQPVPLPEVLPDHGHRLLGSMLEKARERVRKKGLAGVRLLQMDAAHMEFPDNAFDVVYAPYLISVVPDPIKVAAEMRRVCRPGGRIIFLNHFRSENPVLSRAERLISPFTVHIGFKADLDLKGFLAPGRAQARHDREGQHSRGSGRSSPA